MKLRTLAKRTILRGKRIFVRVDWNVPLAIDRYSAKAEKIQRTLPLLGELRERGAVTLILTHLGRPEGRDVAFSTKPLAKRIGLHSRLPIQFLDVDLSTLDGAKKFAEQTGSFVPGDIVCLENVRFQTGEDENSATLVKRYAAAGDLFVNDAFASSHRLHASVAGLAKALPSYAGPSLVAEVEAQERILTKFKRPYVAVIGGSKLTTKLNVIEQLLQIVDTLFIGGAMAHPFFVASGLNIGKSLIDHESVMLAKRLLKHPKIRIPIDAIVSKKIADGVPVRCSRLTDIRKTESIGDIGTETMRTWSEDLRKAQTIVWNGPVGVTELPQFSHGSLVLARAMAMRARGKPFVLVGGGDTLPIIERAGVSHDMDFVSTGGGAMLEFIALHGKLPGLKPLRFI